MLSRRHIRLKVMQSIYSYKLSKNDNLAEAEKFMIKHFEEVADLKVAILSLLMHIVDHAAEFYDQGKKKHLPSFDDLNPNLRFIDNKFVNLKLKDKKLITQFNKNSDLWLDNDHDVITKLFIELYNSNLYSKYLLSDDYSINVDKKFFIDLLNEKILNHKLVHHIFAEKSIYWLDDLPFVTAIILGEIKNDISLFHTGVFKDSTDKKFTLTLFRETISNDHKYDKIIMQFADNWDLDRIAMMDQILLKMAFTEILIMKDLPVKVSMNEYIEIAKYYSTAKSKLFINGLLDNFVKSYGSQGKINKVGRGLIQ